MAGLIHALPWNRIDYIVIPMALGGMCMAGAAVLACELLSVGLAIVTAAGLFGVGVLISFRAVQMNAGRWEAESLSRKLEKLWWQPRESFSAELNQWVFEAPQGMLYESRKCADVCFIAFNGRKTVLDLRFWGDQRTTLPKCLARCANLTKLDLGCWGNLVSLPAELGQCAQLRNLDLNRCSSLASIPAEIGQCTRLETLNLSGCSSLTSLPAELGQCGRLQVLNLLGCRSLHELPEAIFDLPASCTIEIAYSGLSDEVVARIQERVRQLGYNGPRFSYSMAHHNAPLEELSLEDVLARVAQACEEALPDVVTEWLTGLDNGQKELLKAWLNKLSLVGGARDLGRSKLLYQAVMKNLCHAAAHAEFHELLFNNLYDATGSCGDRMSRSLLNLGVARRLSEISSQAVLDANEVVSFLRRAFAISELEGIAARKILSLVFFDEIEVYLGYPIQLQHQLGIQDLLDVRDMLYFRCSGLTENDLEEARNQVVQKWNRPSDRDFYLLSQPIYKKLLRQFGPKEGEVAGAHEEKILETLAERDPPHMSPERAAARRIDLVGELNSVYRELSNRLLATVDPEALAFPNVRT